MAEMSMTRANEGHEAEKGGAENHGAEESEAAGYD